jgi:hypothetical protein
MFLMALRPVVNAGLRKRQVWGHPGVPARVFHLDVTCFGAYNDFIVAVFSGIRSMVKGEQL